MNGQQVLHRLRAHHAGKPLPRYDTIHFPIAKNQDLLILAFLRMGGESAPWGLAVGHPGRRPTLFSVPEARNRDLVADIKLMHADKPLVLGPRGTRSSTRGGTTTALVDAIEEALKAGPAIPAPGLARRIDHPSFPRW